MEYYLVVLTCFFTLLTNTPYHSLKWAILGALSCLGTIIYTWIFSKQEIWKYTISLCCSILLFGIIRIIYDSKVIKVKK